MSLSLQDKHILVTAGANGIGLAIVRKFLASGARVHACDVDADACRALAGSHPNLSVSVADVSSEAQVLDRTATWPKMGPARRAGQQRRRGRSHQPAGGHHAGRMAPDAGRQPDRHLPVRARRAAAARGRRRAIINISSVAGRLGFSLRTPYSASKFRLAGLTQTWAMELGPSTSASIPCCPAWWPANGVERVIAARAAAGGVSNDAMRAQLVSSVSLRRMTQPGTWPTRSPSCARTKAR